MAEKDKAVKVVARIRPATANELGQDIIAYCDSTGKNVTIDVRELRESTFS